MNLSSSMMSYNNGSNILNFFLFQIINNHHMSKVTKTLQNQIQNKMMFSMIHMFNLYFPSPSSYLGKRSFQTSIEPDLDMIRK